MDAISILNGVKNRVLDAKNYELLKSTYDLQNKNIEQLKTSNEGFKEDNKRLREEMNNLKTENESLKKTVAELTQKVSQLSNESESLGLSEAALAILELYRECSSEPLYKEGQIIPSLESRFARIQIDSGIDELEEAKMIEWSHQKSDLGSPSVLEARRTFRVNTRHGKDDTAYRLTKQGRKYLVQIGR